MKRNSLKVLLALIVIIIVGLFSEQSQAANYECRYAVEIFTGTLAEAENLPPIYPQMWMINYPQSVFYAPDAAKLLNRDFVFDTLTHVGSYRILKKASDSIMFLNSKVDLISENEWKYGVRSHIRLGRQLDRVDHFIYRNKDEIYPFTVKSIINPVVVYCFRPDESSTEPVFIFFSYTLHKNFPKSLLGEFSQEDEFVTIGYNPFNMKFPQAVTLPELIYQAEAEYPAHLKKMKRSDTVKLSVLVDRDGTVSDVEFVKKALYTPFDVAAADAAFKSLFIPAVGANGDKVPAWKTFDVIFDANK
jgi:TonB family protein